MSNTPSPRLFRFSVMLICIGLALGLTGCSHKKTNRGHLFRCDWAFEYNRTPWVGCPPESGCDDERSCGCGLGGENGGCGKNGCQNKGFRRHCGLNPECTAKKPCCRSLGCGMWIDPSDPNSFAGMGTGVKACGLTPFCSPMKPCCLTPLCGKAPNQSYMNQQTLMLGNNGMVYPGISSMPTSMPVSPTPTRSKNSETTPSQPNVPPGTSPKKPPTVAGPNGLLISMGIVPGVSTITSGGLVAAAGVATPVGVMTPSGVQLPNGMINSQAVIKACTSHPGCSAARPCGMAPGCGMLVPVAMVSNNAMMLASTLSAPGVAGGVMQAGGQGPYGAAYGVLPGYVNGSVMQAGGIPAGRTGSGMLVNPITGQPISGLTMSGAPQMGYPPIGYTPTGYSPRYPRFDGLGVGVGMQKVDEEVEEEEPQVEPESPITRSQMPVPRFHPVPSKPAFQRSEGMPVTPKSESKKVSAYNTLPEDELASDEESGVARRRIFSKDSVDAAMERAYLQGMSEAMDNVEEEFAAKDAELAKVRMKAKVLDQAEKLQAKIDRQKRAELRARQEELERRTELLAQRQAERSALEEAQIRQVRLQQSQLQQAQIQQAQLMQAQMTQPVQAAYYNGPVGHAGKGTLASTLDFLKGSDEPPAQRPRNMQQVAMVAPNAGNGGQESGFGLFQSARALGNDLMSPISGLWNSGSASPMQQQPIQYGNQVPRQRVQQVAQPVQARTVSQAPCVYPLCPPQTVSRRAAPQRMPLVEPSNEMTLEQPMRPPTGPRQYKKVLDVDDDNPIQAANYVERN